MSTIASRIECLALRYHATLSRMRGHDGSRQLFIAGISCSDRKIVVDSTSQPASGRWRRTSILFDVRDLRRTGCLTSRLPLPTRRHASPDPRAISTRAVASKAIELDACERCEESDGDGGKGSEKQSKPSRHA